MSNRRARNGPARLAEKLKQIRERLGVSQSEMISALGAEGIINRTHVANFERGEREPTLPILLRYARTANVYIVVLADDSLDLPNEIPGKKKRRGSL